MKVTIAGAGTAGLAAAIFLRRQGHAVTVYEAISKADPVGAGFLIQPTGQRVLAELGLLKILRQKGAVVKTLEGSRGNFRCLNLSYNDLNPGFSGLGLHRANLQHTLLKAAIAAGVKIKFESPVTHLESGRGERRVCFVAGTKNLEADLMIIADGTRSQLRPLMPIAQKSRPYPWGAFWLICESDSWPYKNILIQKYGEPWRTSGVLPTGKHPSTGRECYSIFWSIPASQFDLYRNNGLNLLEKNLRTFWPEAAGLLITSRHSNWSVASYADTRMARWHHGRLVVLGDAAHSMSPQLGQGANLALVDAWQLSRCLEQTGDIPLALAAYSNLRKGHLRWYRLASRWMTPLYQSYLPLGIFRDLGTWTFGKIKPLYREMLGLLSGYKGFRES